MLLTEISEKLNAYRILLFWCRILLFCQNELKRNIFARGSSRGSQVLRKLNRRRETLQLEI